MHAAQDRTGCPWPARARVHRRAGSAGVRSCRLVMGSCRRAAAGSSRPSSAVCFHLASLARRRAVCGLLCPRFARQGSAVASRAPGPAGARWIDSGGAAAQRCSLRGRPMAGSRLPRAVGAENLCHRVIFMNRAPARSRRCTLKWSRPVTPSGSGRSGAACTCRCSVGFIARDSVAGAGMALQAAAGSQPA
jgi:hypothetical protein